MINPNPTLIRERLEWVKDEIILAPGRFHLAWMRDKDYQTGGTYIVGCVAGWLDYLKNGEDHFSPTRSNLQIRLTAANMIGSEDIYPTLFNHELNTGAVYGTVEYAEFGCRMIDEYLKGIDNGYGCKKSGAGSSIDRRMQETGVEVSGGFRPAYIG